MLKVASYTIKGVKSQETLPKEYDSKPNLALLAQAVRVYEDRSHTGSSKERGELDMDQKEPQFLWGVELLTDQKSLAVN